MKKLSLILPVIQGILLTTSVKAQTKPDNFVGKWTVVITGTPSGEKVNAVMKPSVAIQELKATTK